MNPDPQRFGSLVTYYKRYQLQALLLISTSEEDDDGNSVSNVTNNTQSKPVSATNNVPASDAQKSLLKRLGVQFSDNLSKNEASKLIEQANKK
jgi:hypothetical protein